MTNYFLSNKFDFPDKYRLPKSVKLGDVEVGIDSDYRNILQIFSILNDPDLLEVESVVVALDYFYESEEYKTDIELAVEYMMYFLNGGRESDNTPKNAKPLYDWDKDFDIIVSPINRIVGTDVRGLDYMHWWTFLSAFMEIGECTFNTFVGIRDKMNRGIRLEKWEERIYRDNKDRITLKKRVDSTTQSLMDEIMGKGV